MRLLALLLISVAAYGQATYRGLTIPASHPRLIFGDSTRRAAAQAWWNAGNSFTPNNQRPADLAFAYLMTGNTSYCTTAINFVLALQFADPTAGAAPKDAMRWNGFNIPATYDWCYDVMTSDQRTTLVDRWNGYLSAMRASGTAGSNLESPYYNYYWGYFRIETLWGIATYQENQTAAEEVLDYALGTRWTENAAPYNILAMFANQARGGIPHEGWQYGGNVHEYLATVALATKFLGRDLTTETDWQKWNLFAHIYNSTTAPVRLKGSANAYYEQLPHGDTHEWASQQTAGNDASGIGAAMYAYVPLFYGTNYAGYAQQYINTVNPTTLNHAWIRCLAAIAGSTPTPLAYNTLDLDFLSTGNGWLTSRSSWNSGATMFNVQAGQHRFGIGHFHADYGNFTLQRGDRWLTRESAAYGQSFPNYNNGAALVAAEAHAHNTIFMDGKGPSVYVTNGQPVVGRMEVGTDHSYISTTLTDSYRTNITYPSQPSRDNPAAVNVSREYVFIRPLETLVIFDRLETQNTSQMKTFMLHTEASPTLTDGQTVHYTSGGQTLHMRTVLPSSPIRRIVNETTGDSLRGQYRLEEESSGATQQYFLHVLQARDASGTDLTINYSKVSTTHILELSHPTFGYARVEFEDGMTSTGGGFAYSASSAPSSVTAFRSDVQATSITEDGPVWDDGTPPLAVTTTTLASGTVGEAYSQTLSATSGAPPYSWSVVTGSLPDGLTLSGNTISGFPTTAGTTNFTVRVTDTIPDTDDQALSIVVAASPTGADFHVCPSGCAYDQITDVVGLVAPGDVVEVDGDADYDPFTLSTSGTSSAPITIRGVRVNGNRPTISTGARAVQLDGDWAVFEGFDISGSSDVCIRIFASDVVVQNNYVHGCLSHGILSTDTGSGNITIRFNEITTTGNQNTGNLKHPIYLATDQSAHPGSTCIIENNYLHDNTGGEGFKSRCERNEVRFNMIVQNANPTGVTYYNMSLYGPEAEFAVGGVREDGDVVGNVFVNSVYSSMVRLGSDTTDRDTEGRYRFVGNTFLSFHASPNNFIRVSETIESVELINNIFWRANGTPTLFDLSNATWTNGQQTTGTNNWIHSSVGSIPAGVTGSVTGTDPGLTNVAGVSTFDPRPILGGAVVNAGTSTTTGTNSYPVPLPSSPSYMPPLGVTADFLAMVAIERPQHAIPDIGAFELDAPVGGFRERARGRLTITSGSIR